MQRKTKKDSIQKRCIGRIKKGNRKDNKETKCLKRDTSEALGLKKISKSTKFLQDLKKP